MNFTEKTDVMKKTVLLVTLLFAAAGAFAQGIMVVNTEKIFKAIPRYNEVITQIDKLGEQYQKNVDQAYANIEQMYNSYVSQKAYLDNATRQNREDAIIKREQEAGKYQESIFGPEGELMKKRVELIKPIQDVVFAAINKYAGDRGFTMVIDIANNPSVLYYVPTSDKTDEIINLVK